MDNDIGTAAADPLIPAKTPFSYNVGINYEAWEVGRTGYSITADLNQIFANFRLIRTYHDAAVGTANPKVPQIDADQKAVIDWVVKHPGTELVMGTNNNAIAQGGFGTPWSAGLMASKAYTDLWAKMIVNAFGGVANAKVGLKTILLGNELDQNGPPPSDAKFNAYVNNWIPAAFDNLKASLAGVGLGSIPITTSIANYGPSNAVSVKIPTYIYTHWSKAWNNGEAFVMFNQYTQNFGQSTNYAQVEQYFESVAAAWHDKLEVFVGETGYSTYWGAANQASVYKQMFAWLNEQRLEGGKTVPLFAFDAFDRPAFNNPPQEVQFGIYGDNAQHQPTGLKNSLKNVIPAWTKNNVTLASADSEALYGSAAGETIRAQAGHDIVLGGAGGDRLLGQAGSDLLIGGSGNDTLDGGQGHDQLDGGGGADVVSGGGGSDRLQLGAQNDAGRGGAGNDTILGQGGRDEIFGDGGSDFINGGLGNDELWGGADADVFAYNIADWGRDVVKDFEDGIDLLRIKDRIADDISDFVVTGNGTARVVLSLGEASVTLLGSSPIILTNADFQFIA